MMLSDNWQNSPSNATRACAITPEPPVPDIHIHREHHLGRPQGRRVPEKAEKFDMDCAMKKAMQTPCISAVRREAPCWWMPTV